MTTHKISLASRKAIAKYGYEACIRAYVHCDKHGEGASTVAIYLGLSGASQAGAAIQAGREIVTGVRF